MELRKMSLTTEYLIVYLFVLVEFKLHNPPTTKYLNVSSNKATCYTARHGMQRNDVKKCSITIIFNL